MLTNSLLGISGHNITYSLTTISLILMYLVDYSNPAYETLTKQKPKL